MRKFWRLVAVGTFSWLLFVGSANAAVHRPRCRSPYAAKLVRVRVHRDHRLVWVKRWRCVKTHRPTKSTTAPSTIPIGTTNPAITTYRTSVDPSFTQSSLDPLAVTYAYSADAFAGSTDLGAVGSLPAGVLNLYSATSPGQSAGLECSINVGGSITGGACTVHYANTGTYAVTTEYVPNGVTAVTQTDSETISPYSTSTTETATNNGCSTSTAGDLYTTTYSCLYTLSSAIADQNGNALQRPVVFRFDDGNGDIVSVSSISGQECQIVVSETVPAGTQSAGGTGPYDSSQISSSSCSLSGGWGNIGLVNGRGVQSWSLVASFGGVPGYTGSQSDLTVVTPY